MTRRFAAHATSLVLLFVALLARGADTFSDGPYVVLDDNARWTALYVRENKPFGRETRIDANIVVPGVGALPSFEVRLREPDFASSAESLPANDAPIFVMADTHGELAIAVALLQAHDIIDDSLRWSFGRGRLVILGDVFDRGAHHTELLWLIYKLEAEAAHAGGAVVLVLGNHEAMVLLGDDRYLHPKYRRTAQAFGAAHYAALWSEKTLLGRWLRTKSAVVKVGQHLCVHGGLSPQVLERKLTLAQMNSLVRNALGMRSAPPDSGPALETFVMGQDGPLWYRGYFEPKHARDSPAAHPDDIARILAAYDANKILIGHTRVPAITPLYGGSVIAVQVYPHNDASGAPVMEGLLIQAGRYYRVDAQGRRRALSLARGLSGS